MKIKKFATNARFYLFYRIVINEGLGGQQLGGVNMGCGGTPIPGTKPISVTSLFKRGMFAMTSSRSNCSIFVIFFLSTLDQKGKKNTDVLNDFLILDFLTETLFF